MPAFIPLLPTPQRDASAVVPTDGPQPLRKRKAAGASIGTSGPAPTGDSPPVDDRALAELAPLVAKLADAGAEPRSLLQALTKLRQAFATQIDPPIQELIAIGGLPSLAARLCSPETSPISRLECAWVLTNAASGTSEQTAALVEAGVPAAAIAALASPQLAERHELCDQLLWVLGNIAGDTDPKLRDQLLADGILPALQVLFTQMPSFSWQLQGRAQVLRTMTWLMSSLCRGDPAPAFESVDCLFDYFAQAVAGSEDDKLLYEALWGICYLLEGAPTSADASLRSARLLAAAGEAPASGAHPLIQRAILLARRGGTDPSFPLPIPALRLLGIFVSTSAPEVVDAALASGLVGIFRSVLTDAKAPEEARRDAAWALSNAAAGTLAQAQAVLTEPKAFEALCETAEANDVPQAVRRECAWAVANLAKQLPFAGALDARRVLCVVARGIRAVAAGEPELTKALLDAAELALRHGDELGRINNMAFNPIAGHGEAVGLNDLLDELSERASEAGIQRKAAYLATWFARTEGGKDGEHKGPASTGYFSPSAIGGNASPKRKAAYRFGA